MGSYSTILLAQTDEPYEPFQCMGVTEEDGSNGEEGLQYMPTPCNNWDDECIVYIKVGVYFVKGASGNWAYTPTGNKYLCINSLD